MFQVLMYDLLVVVQLIGASTSPPFSLGVLERRSYQSGLHIHRLHAVVGQLRWVGHLGMGQLPCFTQDKRLVEARYPRPFY